jgi:dipeptidyl aminopeptidase/acylaminoacyl peptidase
MSFRHTVLFGVLGSALLAALVKPPAVQAQETRSDTRLTVQHYLDFERVSDPQISPDGSRIIYTRDHVNQLEDRWESSLWIMNGDGSGNRFYLKGSGARWSPDGRRILYLADDEKRNTQIFVRWVDGEAPATQITRVVEGPRLPNWSPDGRTIAFSMLVAEQNTLSISLPPQPKGAKWTDAPRYVETLHYRQDRVGHLDDGFVQLFVVPGEGSTPRQLTKGRWNIPAGELRGGAVLDWTPDSRTIVFSGQRIPDGVVKYDTAQLYALDVASGEIRELVSAAGYWQKPAVSPDGRSVAFTGYAPTGRSHTVEDLFVVPITGGAMRKISGATDRDPINLRWAPDSTGVFYDTEDRGARNLLFAPLAGVVTAVTTGTHVLTLDSLARSLVGVGTIADPARPPDIARYSLKPPAGITRLTDVNGDILAGKQIAVVEELWYTSTGNTRVQGWIVKPPAFDVSKKYPLILEIHGGPFAMYNVGFNWMFQNFAANDFVVLYTNPRGSTGYGSDFSAAIDHNYPGPDYDDLMAGVEALVAKGYVDTTRMYVSGCSGGGVLSSWVIGHTNRFAAAAVRCPVTNWLSMAGHTDIPLFTYSFFKKPFWEDPTDWLAHSTLMHVGKVTTPTLLMTGVSDRRTPMPQTEEYFAALKMRGVPAALLQFNEEYHGTSSKPSNWLRTQLYMMSWFNKYSRQGDGRVRPTTNH